MRTRRGHNLCGHNHPRHNRACHSLRDLGAFYQTLLRHTLHGHNRICQSPAGRNLRGLSHSRHNRFSRNLHDRGQDH